MPALPILRRRRERRIEQRQQKNARLTGGLISAGLVFSTLLGLLIIASVLAYASLTADLPALETIPALLEPPTGSLLQPTRIYDRSGEHLLAVLAPQDAPRRYISLSAIDDKHFPNSLAVATVALIDPGFWGHPGTPGQLRSTRDVSLPPIFCRRSAVSGTYVNGRRRCVGSHAQKTT